MMKRALLLGLVAAAAVLGGCGATLRQPPTWTAAALQDDGDNCSSADDVTPWGTALRTLIVQARRTVPLPVTSYAEVLRVTWTGTSMAPAISVATNGTWVVRGMVADSLGVGCWSNEVTREARSGPSVVRAQ